MQDEDFHAVIADAVGQVFITNGVGKHIIGLCDGLNTKEQIVSTVMSAYGSTAVDQVRKEVMRFLTAVTNMGVVTWTDAPRAPSGRHRSPRSP
ncbi:MAG TPA: PqqD family protein [Pilimelia sp.]|nr:PqqD family protein [Pilimelia sp.]